MPANDTLDLAGMSQAVDPLDGTGTVTINGSPAATLTTGGQDTSATLSGIIQNGTTTTAFSRVGTGTQSLTGDSTYTGGTTISAGTLQIGNGGTIGSIGAGAISDNGTLMLDRSDSITFANAISGSGGIVVRGVGTGNTATLSGALTNSRNIRTQSRGARPEGWSTAL